MELPVDPYGTIWKHGSLSCIILADSTIMLQNCSHHLVTYDQKLLGLTAGGYGCAFFNGAFDPLKHWIKAGKPGPEELVVAYVPAEDFKDRNYDEHATHQVLNLGSTCIRTPTINTFAKVYSMMTGENMIKNKGVHLTENGRKWFAWALTTWARETGAQLVLCVGWNAGQCKKHLITKQIEEEYLRQRMMVKELHEWHRSNHAGCEKIG